MRTNKRPGRDAEPKAGGPMRTEGNSEIVVAASVPPVPAALTEDEADRLLELEAVVERNYSAVMETRSALVEIKERRLYRATHATFRDYLTERWNMTPSYASRLLRAGAVVAEARRLSPDVAHGQPPAERAVREVNDLPVEEAAKVLVVATEAARAEGREVPVVADVRKARAVVVPEPEPEPEEALEAFVAELAWPRIAKTINSLLDEVPEAQRVAVLNGFSNLTWDLSREWEIKDGPLEQAIRMLEHVASRPDEEFRQHRAERDERVRELSRLLWQYQRRDTDLAGSDRKLGALVPGSIWQRPARSGYRYLHVDGIDEKGIVSFRKDDAPSVVARQKREAFLEKASIASFDYNRDAKRRGEKVRATFAAATASPKPKVVALEKDEVEETDLSTPHGLSCARCGGTGPMGGRPVHRPPCVPEAK